MRKKALGLGLAVLLTFGCVRFWLLSPFYALADLFYFTPKSAFDTYDGEGRKGPVWFPATRIACDLECG